MSDRPATMDSVFQGKKDCCGCQSCRMACPTHSIRMVADDHGFEYPAINRATCVDCGKCRAVCPMLHASGRPVEETFAAILDDGALARSASGGAFYALGKAFLENGGVVFGCAFDERLVARHVEIGDVASLRKTQGSKYVQSDMDCHHRVRELLESGRQVLFSGTPCQVAAVRSFIKPLDAGLFTVELICHGVPNATLWKDYVGFLEKRYKGTISEFVFRSKDCRGRFGASFTVASGTKRRVRRLPSVLSSYYHAFLKGKTYRPSCYACPFACPPRQADVTLGDFWGYKGRAFRGRTDVSAVLIQGEKGRRLFEMARKHLKVETANFADIAAGNEQLRQPSDPDKFDEGFFRLWKEKGMSGIERRHRREHWKAWLLHLLGRL